MALSIRRASVVTQPVCALIKPGRLAKPAFRGNRLNWWFDNHSRRGVCFLFPPSALFLFSFLGTARFYRRFRGWIVGEASFLLFGVFLASGPRIVGPCNELYWMEQLYTPPPWERLVFGFFLRMFLPSIDFTPCAILTASTACVLCQKIGRKGGFSARWVFWMGSGFYVYHKFPLLLLIQVIKRGLY